MAGVTIRNRLTNEDIAKVIELYFKYGLDKTQITSQYRCSRTKIERIINDYKRKERKGELGRDKRE